MVSEKEGKLFFSLFSLLRVIEVLLPQFVHVFKRVVTPERLVYPIFEIIGAFPVHHGREVSRESLFRDTGSDAFHRTGMP